MKRHILFILTLLLFFYAKSQPNCIFTHYSSENGLSQNSIMSMVQDHNGVLWFSTWDGINRFNGYDFKVYKARQGNKITMTNNRVDLLEVDPYNYIWLQTYDYRVYRFDQRTEKFEQIPAEGEEEGMRFSSIKILPDSVIWLLSENEGAVRVKTNPKDYSITTQVYATHSRGGNAVHINQVFSDAYNQEWLLTDNGLLKITNDKEEPVSYFVNIQSGKDEPVQAFYSFCSYGDELYFGSDRGRIWCYSLQNEIFRLWELPVKDKVIAINEIKGTGLLITTAHEGLILYHSDTKECKVYNKSNCPEFPADAFRSVYVDSKQEAWFEMTEWGKVCHFNPLTEVFKQEKMQVEPRGADRSYPSFHICEDLNGNLWVHPQGGGLSWYDREANRLLPFYNDPDSPDWHFSNKLHSMLSDKQGNLWLCTHSKGLEKITFLGSQFHIYPRMGHSYDLNSNTVRALFEDSEHRIWMGKRDGQIEIYSSDLDFQGILTEEGDIAKSGRPLRGVPYHIMQDSHGNIWIATKGDGIILAEKEGTRFKFTRFKYDEDDIYSLSHNSVYWLHEDKHGRIWVATFGGGLNYIQKTPEGKYVFISSRNNLKGFPYDRCYRVRHITSDKKGNIWVGSSDGALSFKEDFKDPESIVFHLYARIPDDMNCLSNNNVYRIVTTSQGEVYLATFGGGLNQLVSMNGEGKAVFKSYTVKDGLPSDILLSVEEDDTGNLWISTENGLSKFIPSEQRFENYNERDFGGKIRFEEGTSLNLSSSTLLFGTSRGMLYFEPEHIKKSNYVPSIVFGTLKISNQEVIPGVSGSLLRQSLDNTEHLVLSHKENIVTLSFAALDMIYPENIRYAYRLHGFDKEWNYVDKQRTATYTNLPKGDYVFQVKSTNSDGVWVENERSLRITIQPSFWETAWAMAIYILAFLLILFSGVYILFTIYRLKHEVSVEQQVSDIKLRFFTNISHELRTPLTLIAGPVEYVLKNKTLPDDVREQLHVVERNTDRMLRLVNQILDFRKIQKNKMKLRIEQIDIVPFVHHIMDNFESLAEEHHIDFVFESEMPSLKLWVDADKLEKIVFNLLSNAFKYTPSNGKIIFKVDVQEQKKQLCIQVIDTGLGIPKEKRAELFKRFMQSSFSHSSVGVGLHLTYGLVNIHKGTISYNENEGSGSIFTVELPTDASVYEEKDFLVPNQLLIEEEKQRHKEFVTDENTDEQAAPPVPLNKRKVLIIEDDNDVREFLKEEIGHYFEVVAEADGISGFERAQTYDADLIICDVLMPGMTGFEVTKKLKNEFATSHIPIILLTALNMEEKYLEGIESGADAYITKPFSISLLLARISKLIEQRDKLREKFSNEPGMVHAAICTNNKDSKFLAKLNEMLNEHMVETEFSVDDYANLMGLGRTVFYKKVRGVTGYSPNEYLRVIRLKKAAELLLTEDLTVSEISYKVGINDPYYFSKCFKNQFGIAPSVYQKNGGKAPASNDTAENTEQASEEKEEGNKTDV